jgi:hypothetical protein
MCVTFALQQHALALHAPAVTRQRAVAAHHAMAGNCHRQRIGRAGLRHRTRRFRRTNARGDLRITRRRAGIYVAQCLPYAPLERRTSGVQRQVELRGRGRFDQSHHLRRDRRESGGVLAQPGNGESLAQPAFQRGGIVAEQDRADPALAGGDENLSQRTLRDRIADVIGCNVRIHREPVGLAAFAWTKSGVLRVLGGGMKRDVLGPRTP